MKRKLPLIILFSISSFILNAQIITTLADSLTNPFGIAVDTSGYVYSSLFGDNQIRKINISTGLITIIAGTPTAGYNGDGIAATSAQLNTPLGIAIDDLGNIYIADAGNYRVRKIDKSTGLISTIAGTGTSGYNGDGILATTAQFIEPDFVAVDPSGNVYVADPISARIRKINKITGMISTIAGTGTAGYNGDGILATSAQINAPEVIDFDEFGNIIFFDDFNQRLRKIAISTGIITTIAGTGVGGYSGDGGPATSAEMGDCEGLDIDAYGNIYLSDGSTPRIRKIDKSTGIINCIAGGGTSGLGDGGLATAAQLSNPEAIAIDQFCNMYIADFSNNRIRKITGLSNCINAIDEQNEKMSINFYPNPFNTTAKIEIENRIIENGELKVSDIFGRTVKVMSNIHEKEILLEKGNLKTGIYFYQLSDNSRILAIGKFIID